MGFYMLAYTVRATSIGNLCLSYSEANMLPIALTPSDPHLAGLTCAFRGLNLLTCTPPQKTPQKQLVSFPDPPFSTRKHRRVCEQGYYNVTGRLHHTVCVDIAAHAGKCVAHIHILRVAKKINTHVKGWGYTCASLILR